MTRSDFIATLGFGILALAATQTHAQTQAACAERDRVIERLATVYGETRQSMGLARDNQVIEVYASGETGTWTITVTTPSGITCLVASGQGFETTAEMALPAPGDDA